MKAVLMSIQPKWCELIASGKKTVEVRKTKPKLETPFKVYIYCTKGQHETLWRYLGNYYYDTQFPNERPNRASGKVIGEFVCDKVFDICIEMSKPDDIQGYPFPCTGLTDKEILQYLGNGKTGYGWHISDLVIYDTPKELSEFHKPCKWNYDCCTCEYWGEFVEDCCLDDSIKRPPQSWCYVERSDNNGE